MSKALFATFTMVSMENPIKIVRHFAFEPIGIFSLANVATHFN